MYSLKGDSSRYKHYLLLSIVVPVLLHGFYDYCIFSGNVLFILLFFVFIISLYVVTLKRVKRVSLDNKSIHYKYNFCPNCGSPVVSDICSVYRMP